MEFSQNVRLLLLVNETSIEDNGLMDLQNFIKNALILVVTFFVSAYPLHTQANSLGVERGGICATKPGSDLTACPQDFTHHEYEAIELCLTALDYGSVDVNREQI